jgi:RNA polymerase sigma-70 factor (ECF subfamily)
VVANASVEDQGAELLALYDRALPQVYGYLVSRCGSPSTAEDLTAETFLAAVEGIKKRSVPALTSAWLIGVARHKLVDHWRRQGRESAQLQQAESEQQTVDDPWDAHLDQSLARTTLAALGAHHRAALTMRYLDGLSVPEVAAHLDRTVHATEALLVRARIAFRKAYGTPDTDREEER